MSFLALERLEKVYPDGTHAVRGVDLAIARGELVVLLGPSGCGKTTTLRMVAGLELPTGGRILLDGEDVTSRRPARRDVGFVFQFYALYPHLTVRENVEFPLECAGVPRRERRAAALALAQRLGLGALLGRLPRELSGGDQQKVALARAMVRRPAVWLMDEPLGTLDADRRVDMGEFLRAQQLEARVTTLYVTHDQDEAMRLADRVVVMRGGEVLQVGTPAEVYERPESLFVADFVGRPGMNLLAGEVRAGAGGARFHAPGIDLPLARPARAGAAVLGVRPEFVRSGAGALRGALVRDEYLGNERLLRLALGAGELVARVPADGPRPAAGESVPLALDPAHVLLFDPADGRRLA